MKNEISKTEQPCTLHSVIGMLPTLNEISKEAKKYRKETANQMAIEQAAFTLGAEWYKKEMEKRLNSNCL